MVSDVKSSVIWFVFPLSKVVFLSHCFQDFFSPWVFKCFTMMCVGMDFFGFILFKSAFLESVGLCVFANWGSFQLLFLQVLFSSAVFPFFFWIFSDTNVRYLRLCPCVFSVYFLSVHIRSFLLSYPHACWFFSLSTSFWIFYFDISIFQLWDFHLVLLLSSISLLRLSSFFICTKHVFYCPWRHFYDGCFKVHISVGIFCLSFRI